MGTTANYGWAYPELIDEPNVPLWMKTLADAADADLQALADTVGDGGGGGGGGGGSQVGGTWRATGAGQSIPATVSGPGTAVAFGAPDGSPTGVTRNTEGSGHHFVLGSTGLWHAAATIRVATAAAAGEISCGIWLDTGSGFDDNLAHDGGRREGMARTLNPGASRWLASGTKVVVYLYNGTGSTRTLEPSSGDWVHIDLWRS